MTKRNGMVARTPNITKKRQPDDHLSVPLQMQLSVGFGAVGQIHVDQRLIRDADLGGLRLEIIHS